MILLYDFFFPPLFIPTLMGCKVYHTDVGFEAVVILCGSLDMSTDGEENPIRLCRVLQR